MQTSAWPLVVVGSAAPADREGRLGARAAGYAAEVAPDTPLAVAVTGPTGTFGFGLVPLLEADPRIGASWAWPVGPSTPPSTAGRR